MTRNKFLVATVAAVLFPGLALAQEAAPASETSIFIFNTLLSLAAGASALLAIAGFAIFQAGLVRARNAASTLITAASAVAIASLAFWFVGFNLQNGAEPGGLLGAFKFWSPGDLDPVGAGVASSAQWFSEAMLAALGVAIIAGAVAGRTRLLGFVIFSALYSGFIYPVGASWHWGGGYLHTEWKFHDFAGAGIIHVAAGAAALAGAIVIGPRRGRFAAGKTPAAPPSNLPLAAIGAFLIWASWFSFIAAGRGTLASVGDAIAIATALANAEIAAAAAVLSASVMTVIIHQKVDPKIAFSGLIGGLVAISAEPIAPAAWQAALIGAMAGVIVASAAPLLERIKIDDVANVVPAHLMCGVWGVLIAAWVDADISIAGQIVGVLMIAGFSFVVSALLWIMLKYSIGLRMSAEREAAGLDRTALGADAYPEFQNS